LRFKALITLGPEDVLRQIVGRKKCLAHLPVHGKMQEFKVILPVTSMLSSKVRINLLNSSLSLLTGDLTPSDPEHTIMRVMSLKSEKRSG
jgi:hypothetical protein